MKRLCRIAAGLAVLAVLLLSGPAHRAVAADSEEAARPIHVLTMDGAISPAFFGYLNAGMARAQVDNAQLVIIELNTPGGLLSSTRDMVSRIIESPIPVAVWVTPSGAHAASAGTFILYAAHIAAMDEGTNVGAATPIEMRGQTGGGGAPDLQGLKQALENLADPNEKALRQKSLEDTAAFIRGLALLRGRNAGWGEKAVTEAQSVTATEALKLDVIDVIAAGRPSLLRQLHGRTIAVRNGPPVTLDTAHAAIVEDPPGWKTRFLTVIADPNVALILMSIGVYGLLLEFYHPGTLLPGTIGAISLILGLYAMNILPVNDAGAALMLLGALFMAAECFIPAFGVMGIGGLIAFLTGAVVMFDGAGMPGLGLDWSVVWAVGLFGLMLFGLVVLVTAKVYRKKVSTGPESMVGGVAEIEEWDGERGRVRIQGEVWHAFSDKPLSLTAGERVLVCKIEGLELKIQTVE